MDYPAYKPISGESPPPVLATRARAITTRWSATLLILALVMLAASIATPGIASAQVASGNPRQTRSDSAPPAATTPQTVPSTAAPATNASPEAPAALPTDTSPGRQSPLEALRAEGRAALDDPRASIPTKILRYANRVISRYDLDGDGALRQEEWKPMHGTPSLADLNGDGQITVSEFAARVAAYARRRSLRLMPHRDSTAPVTSTTPIDPMVGVAASAATGPMGTPTSPMVEAVTPPVDQAAATAQNARRSRKYFVPSTRLPTGAGDWFLEKDRDGDAQVSMAEFSQTWTSAEVLEFELFDTNRDGVITPQEYVRGAKRRNAASEQVETGANPETSPMVRPPSAVPSAPEPAPRNP